jgi:hypothetical protein
VTATGGPPLAESFITGPIAPVKSMSPLGAHAPDTPSTSTREMGGPPEASILLSLRSAKKPTWRLSGDQKGIRAPSVPRRGVEV